MLRAWSVLCCMAFCACDRKAPPPPVVEPPGAVETISGAARLGWDQRATTATEIGAIRYALYADNARSELSNATCAPTAENGAFACSASLPALTPGMHTLELASFIIDGSVLESPRSSALRVNVVATTASAARRPPSDPPPDAPAPSVRRWRDTLVDFGNGVVFRLEVVADDVDVPSDMAVAPDGRLFIAERGGRLRVVPGAAEAVVSDARLLAIALDPQFEQTHFVYTISTAAPASADPTFVLARFREVSSTFGDRVILLDNIRAGGPDGAALRFGPDGALYAAFDDGGDEAAANDLASPQGKVLRMNADGSTPLDQAGGSPLFAAGFLSPRGMAWQPGSGMLWVAERRGTLAAVDLQSDAADRKKRGVTRRQYALPESIGPSSIAFAGDDLLVAAGPGRQLLRIRFDQRNPLTIVGTERLLQDRVGPIHVVAAGPDGTIYIAADRGIARLVRVPVPPQIR
jgi:glucose/arabinose dehydrogenase